MWSEEQDATLIKLWEEGKSASTIAAAIGGTITRNSVIGRAHRLRQKGINLKEHERPKGSRIPSRRPRERIIKPVYSRPKPKPLADTLEGSVPLNERTGCMWPVTQEGPHRFCNRQKSAHSPYCEGHAVRAYQPAKARLGKYEVPFQ